MDDHSNQNGFAFGGLYDPSFNLEDAFSGLGGLAPSGLAFGIPPNPGPNYGNGLGALEGLTPSPYFGLGSAPFPQQSALDQALSGLAPSGGLSALAGIDADLQERWRRRAEWNARFEHWEKPASVSEDGTIQRAQRVVEDAISDSYWLLSQSVAVEGQGSYYNRTNTRREADIDLRVQHGTLKVDYAEDVVREYANSMLGFTTTGYTLEALVADMRNELRTTLVNAFGRGNVVVGKKALRVKGITGSRAEVDVVPAVGYKRVEWLPAYGCYTTLDGVAILSTDRTWTYNFPAQHHQNGVAKRARTGHQFKKVVRVIKRLRSDMATRGLLNSRAPSFLVESLVYAVDDHHFITTGDDRFGRICRIARRMNQMVHHEHTAAQMLEINGVKPLFTREQAWTWRDAKVFTAALAAHLGDA